MTVGQANSRFEDEAAANTTTMECRACAETINARAKKCRFCGEILDSAYKPSDVRIDGSSHIVVQNTIAAPAYARPAKSRMAAILLALFLGGIGMHKFYLGRPGQGLLYLIFCWTFIPSVVALIEAIVYILSSDEAFHHKYG